VASSTVTYPLPMLMIGVRTLRFKGAKPKRIVSDYPKGLLERVADPSTTLPVGDEVMIRSLKSSSKIGTKALICQWSCQGSFCNRLQSDHVFVHANMKSLVENLNPVQDAYCTS
jgi:hypothetical protein